MKRHHSNGIHYSFVRILTQESNPTDLREHTMRILLSLILLWMHAIKVGFNKNATICFELELNAHHEIAVKTNKRKYKWVWAVQFNQTVSFSLFELRKQIPVSRILHTFIWLWWANVNVAVCTICIRLNKKGKNQH